MMAQVKAKFQVAHISTHDVDCGRFVMLSVLSETRFRSIKAIPAPP